MVTMRHEVSNGIQVTKEEQIEIAIVAR